MPTVVAVGKLIIIGALVALLAGGGAGAYLFLAKPDPAEAEALAETDAHAAEADAAHADDHGDSHGGQKLEFDLKPILVQLPGPPHYRRNVAFTLSLELTAPDQRDTVVALTPKLRARIFEAWASPPLTPNADTLYDLADVKRRVQRASDATLGAGVVARVLVEDVREILVR